MKDNTIAITSSVPSEVLWAAGLRPLDLNNVFVNHPSPEKMINLAEIDGFPLNCCAWIKGIYGVCKSRDIKTVLCVTNGDCSNTLMLMEVLRLKGIDAVQFAYPNEPDEAGMERSLRDLCARLGTSLEAAEEVRRRLNPLRQGLAELDRLTWEEGRVTGFENHLWLVTASDFGGDWKRYQSKLAQFLKKCRARPASPPELRLAYIGVPPVFASDLYNFVEKCGAGFVFNEVQRQFGMPWAADSLAEQYCRYTYPFCIHGRAGDILEQGERRRVDAVVHYVQAFCHRGIGDIVFRSKCRWPILTLEGNNEFICSQHVKTRIEAFVDMLRRSRSRPAQSRFGIIEGAGTPSIERKE